MGTALLRNEKPGRQTQSWPRVVLMLSQEYGKDLPRVDQHQFAVFDSGNAETV